MQQPDVVGPRGLRSGQEGERDLLEVLVQQVRAHSQDAHHQLGHQLVVWGRSQAQQEVQERQVPSSAEEEGQREESQPRPPPASLQPSGPSLSGAHHV